MRSRTSSDDRPPVVLDTPQLDAPVVVQQRVGGAVVVVERHPHAARVDELDALRRRALELDVGVAEDDAPLRDPAHELGVLVARLVREADHVGARRGVAEQRVVANRLLLQRGEPLRQLVAEQLAAGREGRVHRLGRVRVVDEPAIGVAADPLGVELVEARDRLGRPGPAERVVAAQQEALRRAVVEHSVERAQVAVDVVEQAEHRPHASALSVRSG